MIAPEKRKIFTNEDGERYVHIVPESSPNFTRIKLNTVWGDRLIWWILERIKAGDEEALAAIPWIATTEEVEKWSKSTRLDKIIPLGQGLTSSLGSKS